MLNIENFIKEIKSLKKEASNNGQASLVAFADSMLDFVEYAKADSVRMDYLSDNPQHLSVHVKELRSWIDKQLNESTAKC